MITWGTLVATLAAPLVLLLPGWALLSLLLPPERLAGDPRQRPDAVAWLTLAAGLTLALAPVALLYLNLLGVKLGTAAALAVLALSAAVVAWRRGRAWRKRVPGPRPSVRHLPSPQALALALGMALIAGVRLWVARGLNIGFWGDSYQHTLMTQLILDNGGLFDSWEPYAPLRTFTYHFGFHANTALFQWATAWLSGNPTPRTVVLMGQFLNALAALALYPLAVRLSGGRRWVGVGAVWIAGLLTPTPMFYVNWGRYTQLAGQVILPAAIWFTVEALEAPRRDLRRLALPILAVAGLGLTHYFVLAFYVMFLIPYLAAWLLGRRRQWRRWGEAVLRLAIVGVAACLLVLPWAMRLLSGLLPHILTGYIQGTPSEEYIRQENMFYPLAQFVPHYLAALAGVGGLWALLRRQRTALLLFWVGCLFLLSNPHWLGLPGTAVVNNFTVELALYIPAAILAADLAVALFDLVTRQWSRLRPAAAAVAAALLLLAAVLGVRPRAGVLDPQYQLVTPADEQALRWIRGHTPADARFLVNSFFAYGGTLIVGSDAGWWLPLLAGRENTVPPLNYGGEAGPDPGYGQRINDRALRLEQSALDDPATVRYLHEQGITHLFVGEKGGPLLDSGALRASPYYRLVYPPDRAGAAGAPAVFEVVAP